MPIPAIRGVGGSVIYFVDDQRLEPVWEVEFRPGAGEERGRRLIRIDHVAQTMNYAEMLTGVLFYTSLLDRHKTPMVDVVDPAGLVRSQVIQNCISAAR